MNVIELKHFTEKAREPTVEERLYTNAIALVDEAIQEILMLKATNKDTVGALFAYDTLVGAQRALIAARESSFQTRKSAS